jgi:eukaryotic-like serine/threonine-protein kinase
MRICPRCQTAFTADERFCPHDGTELRDPAPPVSAVAKATDTRLGQILAGQFELVEVCGRGAMGTVYRAWQLGMDRQVAVKILRTELLGDADVVKRFHREARVVARLAHPNIVTCHLVGETPERIPFLVMELVEGEPLSEIAARGVMPVPRALAVVRQIASALADAHAHGVVHRDLKPANILVTQRRRAADFIKVLDFGIAKLVGGDGVTDGSQQGMRLTKEGSVFGTPHYLAPEQAAGHEVDHRADLYSLGVILYRLVTGKLPFEGSGLAVLLAHVNQPPPPPRSIRPELDPGLERLILRALAKDPAKRWQTAEALSDAVDTLLAQPSPWARSQEMPAMDPTVALGPAPVADDLAVPRRSLRWALPLVALPAAALGAGLVLTLRTDRAPAPIVAVNAPPPPPAIPPAPDAAVAPATTRTETLGERGYAARITFPAAPVVDEPIEVIFDVLRPDGAPLGDATLTVVVEEADGRRRDLDLPATGPGRYALTTTFTAAGRCFLHAYPDPRDPEAHVWLDLLVGDAEGRVPPSEAVRGELHGAAAPEDRKLAVPTPPVPKAVATRPNKRPAPRPEPAHPPAEPRPTPVGPPAPPDDDLE